MSDFFDDFNKFGGGKAPFSGDDFKDKGLKEVLRALAPQVLQTLMDFKEPAFRDMISQQAEFIHASLKEGVEMGELEAQLEDASNKMRAVPYNQILSEVQKILTLAADPSEAEKKAENTAKMMADFTEDQYVGFTKAVNNVLPPATREVYNLAANGGKDVEQYARDMYNMTPQQRVALIQEETAKIPADVIATGIYEMLQKATPERLQVFMVEFLTNTAPTDFTEAGFSGMDFAEDLLKTVSRDNSFDIKKPARAKQFAENVEILLTAVEESLITAGITPDTDIKAELTAALKDGPKPQPAAPAVEPVKKNKKPGNGDFSF